MDVVDAVQAFARNKLTAYLFGGEANLLATAPGRPTVGNQVPDRLGFRLAIPRTCISLEDL